MLTKNDIIIAKKFANKIINLKEYIDSNTEYYSGCPKILPHEYHLLQEIVDASIKRLIDIDCNKYDFDELQVYIYSYILVPMIYGELVEQSYLKRFVHIIKYESINELSSFIQDLKNTIVNI